ncbi:DNA phosphorothioation system sulfurtransferase DndC [Dyadobacter sp. CY356]|uniref:DNA phosphorothioation system sulfurtransferase DndC n=1 Tax=Dyadobacter sp. CY356 TaxID=2906442 RepID=UPI001F251B65|nr:DNA phosphorothioation system sulfurtransferase DndC [Dyadobacter sp. CY356]MCF0057684.1 DNA phosphorothioation system sulfurtransferase DndC [Dyadobacter sp. CY356]
MLICILLLIAEFMSIKVPFIESEILDQYLYDENARPWVIGFSGGKDSTLLLQLIWNALKKAPEQLRTREIYVVCNDTLVENPRIVKFIESTLKRIEIAAVEQGLPIKVQRTTPRLEDTFWVNLIGKGYPAPNNSFRWCTERLKINPTTQFIKSKIDERGEVIILLGTRTDESSTRSRSMKKHALKGQRLRKHMLPNAFVYAPISDMETSELWQYLMQVSPPWGGTHKELVTLYKNANSGDCPLVIDESTPSCGNSRFGCWVCTVVKRDKSMEGLIGNGEEWMLPLVEFRDYLLESRDIRENREKRRRFEAKNVEDEETWGPYVEDVRATMLRKLLYAQYEIQQEQGETLQLISHQELIAIQVIWYREGLFRNSVADIYNSIFNTHIDMSKRVLKMREEEQLLREVCINEPEHFDIIQQAVKLVKSKSIMVKKRGMQNDIENLLDNYIDRKELADKKFVTI